MAAKLRHPRINTKGSASRTSLQRLIEFGWTNSKNELCGGLVSFQPHDDRLVVDVYQADPTVEIRNETALQAKANVLTDALSRSLRRVLELTAPGAGIEHCQFCPGGSAHVNACPIGQAQALLSRYGL